MGLLDNVPSTVFHRKARITLVAGSCVFVEKTLAALHDTKRVLVSFELEGRRGSNARKTEWKKSLNLLHKYELRSFKLRDSKCGGATDTVFLFGLGSGPGFGVLPSDNNTIERALRHFLDGGTDTPTNIPVVDLVDQVVLDPPPRKVI